MPSCSEAFRANDLPVTGTSTLATATFHGRVLDSEAATAAANKTPKPSMTARAIAKCTGLNGSGTHPKRGCASN